jgi:hypothetical protein
MGRTSVGVCVSVAEPLNIFCLWVCLPGEIFSACQPLGAKAEFALAGPVRLQSDRTKYVLRSFLFSLENTCTPSLLLLARFPPPLFLIPLPIPSLLFSTFIHLLHHNCLCSCFFVISSSSPHTTFLLYPSHTMAGGSKLSPFGHAIAGTGGAMFALTCTYPLDM